MLTITPIAALRDNYIWCICNADNQHCVIVDPGDAQPVLAALTEHNLQLAAILITHHHADHSHGISGIVAKHPAPVYGPAHDPVARLDHRLVEGDVVSIDSMPLHCQVLDIPGHTLGHIAYYGHGLLFCGDTLFTGGCGRIFEGTPQQMWQSLQKLAALDDDTQVYCGHEYTQANLAFAIKVEPNNTLLQQRIVDTRAARAEGHPTVPAALRLEKQTNPFLRCQEPTVKQAAELHCGHPLDTPVEVLSTIRAWKNQC